MTNLLDDTNDLPPIDPNKDYFAELTGQGGKFYDPDPEVAKQKLARGKYESDTYVPILEKRLDIFRDDIVKLRDENIAGAKLQEQIDKLAQIQQQLASREQTDNSNEEKLPSIADPKQIENLVAPLIERHDQMKTQEANYNLVKDKAKEHYGNNYKSVLKEQAENLGLSDVDVENMARSNPKLFFKTFELDVQKKTENFQTPPNSNRRSDNFSGKAEKRDWKYYLELKKKDPNAWLDSKITAQMHADAKAQGQSFYDA